MAKPLAIFQLAGRGFTLIRNTLRGSDKPRICFHHIPKCAGSSFMAALEHEYMRLRRHPKLLATVWFNHEPVDVLLQRTGVDVSEQALLYHLAEYPDCLFGHVPFSEAAHASFRGDYRFVTILRDPVERFLSHYFYERRSHPERLVPGGGHAGKVPELEEFLDTARGRSFGFMIVNYLTGRAGSCEEPPDAERIRRAIANLGKFDLAGRVEEMPAFTREFARRFGVELQIGKRNENRSGGARKVEPETRRKLEVICAPDTEVYRSLVGSEPRS